MTLPAADPVTVKIKKHPPRGLALFLLSLSHMLPHCMQACRSRTYALALYTAPPRRLSCGSASTLWFSNAAHFVRRHVRDSSRGISKRINAVAWNPAYVPECLLPVSHRPVWVADALTQAMDGGKVPADYSAKARLRYWRRYLQKALMDDRLPSREAALFIGGAGSAGWRPAVRSKRDYLKVSAKPVFHHTPAYVWQALQEGSSRGSARPQRLR